MVGRNTRSKSTKAMTNEVSKKEGEEVIELMPTPVGINNYDRSVCAIASVTSSIQFRPCSRGSVQEGGPGGQFN